MPDWGSDCVRHCISEYFACMTDRRDRRERIEKSAEGQRDSKIPIAKTKKRICLRQAASQEDVELAKEKCERDYDEAEIEALEAYDEKLARAEVAYEAGVEICHLDRGRCISRCPPISAPIHLESVSAKEFEPYLGTLQRINPEAHQVIADGSFDLYTLEEQWDFVMNYVFGSPSTPIPEDMNKATILFMLSTHSDPEELRDMDGAPDSPPRTAPDDAPKE